MTYGKYTCDGCQQPFTLHPGTIIHTLPDLSKVCSSCYKFREQVLGGDPKVYCNDCACEFPPGAPRVPAIGGDICPTCSHARNLSTKLAGSAKVAEASAPTQVPTCAGCEKPTPSSADGVVVNTNPGAVLLCLDCHVKYQEATQKQVASETWTQMHNLSNFVLQFSQDKGLPSNFMTVVAHRPDHFPEEVSAVIVVQSSWMLEEFAELVNRNVAMQAARLGVNAPPTLSVDAVREAHATAVQRYQAWEQTPEGQQHLEDVTYRRAVTAEQERLAAAGVTAQQDALDRLQEDAQLAGVAHLLPKLDVLDAIPDVEQDARKAAAARGNFPPVPRGSEYLGTFGLDSQEGGH